VETYLQHAVLGQEGLDLDAGLLHVAEVIRSIKQANEIEFDIAFNGITELKSLNLEGINAEINQLVDDFPDPDLLDDIQLTCNQDIFLEVLMGNIRNVLSSFQAWLQKIKGARVTAISKQLQSLKLDYVVNQEEIFRLESALCTIRDEDLAAKIAEIKLFDNIHNEKPSPLFLNLIKRKNNDSLSEIRSANGSTFNTDKERESHIVGHFEKIYIKKKPGKDDNFYRNCINDFLGEEIITNPIVTGSKLTEAEKAKLELPLTLAELDLSVKNSNKKSAPGLDGFSNRLIAACWPYLS
jgi:hypothetical protein